MFTEPVQGTPQTVAWWTPERTEARIRENSAAIRAAIHRGDMDRARTLIGVQVLLRKAVASK